MRLSADIKPSTSVGVNDKLDAWVGGKNDKQCHNSDVFTLSPWQAAALQDLLENGRGKVIEVTSECCPPI